MQHGSLKRSAAGAAVVAFLLTGCAAQPVAQNTGAAGSPGAVSASPANPEQLARQLIEYQRSGAYDRDVAAMIGQARTYIDGRAGQVTRPAIVLDIDETSLSNLPEIFLSNFGYRMPTAAGQEGDTALAIAPTLALFNAVKAKEIAVFFVTGRQNSTRAETVSRLRAAGYDGWAGLAMRPTGSSTPSAADFKAPERAKIAARGYTIIANIGDQPSDLAGGYAERTFLVPNPFYRVQ